jgi:amino acid adenylation domain-containing protein
MTGATLDRLIVEQVRRTPGAVAVRQWDRVLTYRELLDAALPLAGRLRAAGAGPEVCVGICTRRTPSMIVAVLGVLLSGAAYVPLDTDHPRQRLAAILDDAQAGLVVADEAGTEALAGTGRTLVPPDGHPPGRAEAPGQWSARPGNAAYVMYTSGSTGHPKGVVVAHSNVIAYLSYALGLFGIDERCHSIGFASLGFDACIADIYAPLICGGSVQLIPEEDRIDPVRLQRFLEHHEVTFGYIPPSLMPLLDPDRLTSLTDIVSSGEPARPEQVDRWSRPPQMRFHNWYGPTETTVNVTGASFEGVWEQQLPIGRPLPGVRAYVLDERMRPCPPGEPGELCIGGPQVTRGYLRMPGRTAEVFIADGVSGEPGARLYRTGDRVAWRPDGMLAYLGRIDRQVKIHGQRVEIGEIETVLGGHPRVRQAVVDIASTAAGVKQLIAYLAPADAPGHGEIREYCLQKLPVYMVPARVVRVDALPRNVAGKVDMRKLREIAASQRAQTAAGAGGTGGTGDTGGTGVAAGQEPGLLETVSRAWAEVLETPAPRPDDDFFASGGHSILAMRLIATLLARTGREVTVEDVFLGQTVAGLAERLAAAPAAAAAVPAGPASSPPELSPAQRRIWFVEQITPGTAAHNIALAERLRGSIDVAALRRALRETAERQEVLRWRIRQRDGIPAVAVEPPGEVALTLDDLTGVPEARREEAARALLDAEARAPFDLATGPLWRVRLVRLGEADHVLAITVHHVVFDGTSISVLYRDLARAYAGHAAEPLAATFADYVRWLRERTSATSSDELAWWAGHLDGVPPVLDLPRDHPRPPIQTFHGASRTARVDAATTERLRELAAAAGATLYTALLAAFGHLAGRLTGAGDLVIGTPLADRKELAFEQVVGVLLHIVPLRLRVGEQETFAGLLEHCRDETAAAFAHADMPFERIVESLGGRRDLSRNPLIQVLFNMYNFAQDKLRLDGLTAEPVQAAVTGSLFDLTMYVSEDPGGLALQAVYNPDLFGAERIDALLASYAHLLGECATQPARPLREISLRPPGSGLPGWDTALPGWDGAGIVERVREAAARQPGEVAVTGPGGPLRYQDVAAILGHVRAAVRDAGAAPGDAVAVLAARDCRLPAALLGVLASGARWMIADPALPDQVLARQAAAVRPRAVVCLEPGSAIPAALAGLPVLAATPADGGAGLPDVPAAEQGYLLLTSGTTGEPKVVHTPERPLAHFAAWYPAAFGLAPSDRFALLGGLGHDPALRDAFIPLVLGARLCVPPEDLLRDPARLFAWLRDEQVTVAHLTPQLARLLALAPAAGSGSAAGNGPAAGNGSAAGNGAAAGERLALRLAALGGDQGSAGDVATLRAMAPGVRVVNFYGTTETPQAQSVYEPPAGPLPDAAGPLPAGRGIDGAMLLVLGPAGQPAAVGELGEVTIRSRHLAAGYLDPELTRRQFGTAPGGDPGDRFFRTGDLGRYRPDGVVVLAGRADGQVKIRGYRVETGEVEAALAGLPDVRQAHVVADGSGQQRRLIACAVPARSTVRPADLLAGLRRLLPEYAVPAEITLLPKLPLTRSGKVDTAAVIRAARRDAGPAARQNGRGALSGPTEHTIAGAWREVLGLPSIGPADNFFDIGGHSLAMATAAARLTERMGRQVTVLDLFRHPTVRELAAHLDGQTADPVFERADYRAAQRRRRARQIPVPAAAKERENQ